MNIIECLYEWTKLAFLVIENVPTKNKQNQIKSIYGFGEEHSGATICYIYKNISSSKI